MHHSDTVGCSPTLGASQDPLRHNKCHSFKKVQILHLEHALIALPTVRMVLKKPLVVNVCKLVRNWFENKNEFTKHISMLNKPQRSNSSEALFKQLKKIFNPKKKCDFQIALKTFTIQKGTVFKQFWVIFDEIRQKKIFLTKSCGF